ncbi:MAG: hypothetical protein R6V85_16300 [Polyangia bacterium]
MTRGLLQRAPEQSDLERLYRELARIGAPAVGRDRPWPYRPRGREELLALAGEMLRHDPRLLSILLQWVLEHWSELNPLELRGQMRRMRWPQALCVVLEFARRASAEPELRYLADYVTAGWPRIDPAQRFFFGAERPGSRTAVRKLSRNLEAYARWGFVGSERPVADVDTKTAVGRYDAKTRRRILDRLLERREELTLAEYLDAVDHAVSRQQAHADLAAHPELEVEGHGRSARWKRT